jgi:hypothetical protein
MALSLAQHIAQTQAAIDALGDSDPKALRKLQAKLASFVVARAAMDDDEDDDKKKGDGDDDEDDDSKSKKAAAAAEKAKRSAEAAKHRAKAAEHKAKAAESEEAAKKCEEGDEEESEEAAAALAGAGHGALLASLAASVKEMKATQTATSKATLISEARKLSAITKTEAADLSGQPLAYVETFLAMRAKAGFVVTNEGDLVKTKNAAPGTEASLPAETLAMIEHALGGVTGEARAALRKELIAANLKAHNDALAQANGAGGRY